jgi:glycerol-3-phosphate acyltransferase PlsX
MLDAAERVLDDELARPARTPVSALLWQQACRRFRARLEHAEHGAAPLVGLRGTCLIGHGRSSARAVRSGVLLAHRLASEHVVARLAEDVAASLARH